VAAKRRIVIVGVGSIGKRHARLLAERTDLDVILVEPDAKALALARQEVGPCSSCATLQEALAAKPELVLIATPHRLHAEQTIQALEAGAQVLCEKPMTESAAAARTMCAAAQRTGNLLVIGFTLHFHPALLALREVVKSGVLGTLLHAHARVGTYLTLQRSASRYQATQDGALVFDYAHQPDALYWILGKAPCRVHAAGFQGGNLELSSNPNIFTYTCGYDEPLLFTVHLNYVQMPQRHEYELVGDEGWAYLNIDDKAIKIGSRRTESTTVQPITMGPVDDVYRAEHQAFLDAVDGKRPPETSAADGLVSTSICDAALRSWRSGNWEQTGVA
jgi:predicted dehydrogenase